MNASKWLWVTVSAAWLVALAGLAGVSGCGKDRSATTSAQEPAKTEPAPVALVIPPLGVDQVRRFNYLYGDGAAAFDKVTAAYKATPRDWAAVRAQSEAALVKDPQHLEAHRALAAALAHDGDYSAAAPHVLAMLAADWLRFGPTLATDPELSGLMSSPVGKQLDTAAAEIKKEFLRRATAGLWLLARRGPFKAPARPGAQYVTPRGELYAYDLEAKRYLRLSETDHAVAGFVRAPSGKELALIGFDKAELPAAPGGPATGKAITSPTTGTAPATAGKAAAATAAIDKGAPPLLARAYVWTLDPATFEVLGKRTSLPKGRRLSVGYGAGEQLLATAAPAAGRWGLGAETWLAIDRSTGKTVKTAPTSLLASVAITFEDGELDSVPPGVVLPGEDAEVASITSAAGAEIRIPESGKAMRRSIAVSPDGGHLAFATATDPCSAETAPSLYVADARSGALKHLLTGKSRFTSTWLDDHTLVYEDPEGALRFWDATTGRETQRLIEKAGIALAALAPSPAPLCKTAPPVVETAATGASEPGGEAGGSDAEPATEHPAEHPVVTPAP